LPKLDDKEGMERHFLARQTFPWSNDSRLDEQGLTDLEDYLPFIATWSSRAVGGTLHKTTDEAISTLVVLTIPDHLLDGSGGWTPEDIELLKLLRQGQRFWHSRNILAVSAPELFEGMANAIIWGRLDALRILLELHSAVLCPGGSIAQPGRRYLAAPSTHPIPLELFHLATRQGDASTGFICLLLRQGVDSIPFDDEKLTQWALHSKNDVAQWLLKYMEGSWASGAIYNLGMPMSGSLFFHNGKVSWRWADSHHPFPDSTFTQEIGYVYQGAMQDMPEAPDGGFCG